VSQCAAEGDLLLVAKCTDGGALVVVAEKDTLIERQLLWLFDLSEQLAHPGFSVRAELETNQDKIGFAARVILEQVGIAAEEEAPDYLEQMLARFGKTYPKAELFSAYARSTLNDVSSLDSPDGALIAWMEHEEVLYRTLENHLLCEQFQEIGLAGIKDASPVMSTAQSFFNDAGHVPGWRWKTIWNRYSGSTTLPIHAAVLRKVGSSRISFFPALPIITTWHFLKMP